jgi:outer membrane protein assembly factor BamB
LHELRDALYEADVESDLAEELLESLEEQIILLRDESMESLNEPRKEQISDLVHRVERFCQRQAHQSEETSTDSIESNTIDSEKPSAERSPPTIESTADHQEEQGKTTFDFEQPTGSGQDQRQPTETDKTITPSGDSTSKGGLQWDFPVASEFDTAPTVGQESVYAITSEGTLYAVSIDNGTFQWKASLPTEPINSPVVAHQTVYVGDTAEQLHAFDGNSGDHLWEKTPERTTENGSIREITAADGLVYFCGGESLANGYVYAINPTGEINFRVERDDTVHSIASTPEKIYYSISDQLSAIEKADQEKLWSFETGEGNASSIVATTDTVYVAGSKILYAINTTTGTERWRTSHDSHGIGPRAVDDGVLCVDGWFEVLAFEASSGSQQWEFAPGRSVGKPVLSNGVAYITHTSTGEYEPEEYRLYALEQQSGSPLWSYQSDIPMTSPAVYDGTVFVGDNDGHLKAVSSHRDQRLS